MRSKVKKALVRDGMKDLRIELKTMLPPPCKIWQFKVGEYLGKPLFPMIPDSMKNWNLK